MFGYFFVLHFVLVHPILIAIFSLFEQNKLIQHELLSLGVRPSLMRAS